MKPKAGEVLGESKDAQPESTEIMGSGENIELKQLKEQGYYIQFPFESLAESIEEHHGEPFDSIQECFDFATESNLELGQTFNVVDINGKVFKKGIITHEGAEAADWLFKTKE